MTHELKILPEFFRAVNCGEKNFEIRKNDRDYQKHDVLILKEWDGEKYTGRQIERSVGYIYNGDGSYGLAEGYCILALKRGRPTVTLDSCKDCIDAGGDWECDHVQCRKVIKSQKSGIECKPRGRKLL